jgi:hypothetical protein
MFLRVKRSITQAHRRAGRHFIRRLLSQGSSFASLGESFEARDDECHLCCRISARQRAMAQGRKVWSEIGSADELLGLDFQG